MKTVDLPDGSTAEVREASDLTRGERKELRRKSMIAMGKATKVIAAGFDETDVSTWEKLTDFDPDDIAPFDDFEAELVLVGLVSWTRKDPVSGEALCVPASLAEWDNIRPVTIYDTLVLAVKDIAKDEDFTADGADDPKAPTAASTSSTPSGEVKP